MANGIGKPQDNIMTGGRVVGRRRALMVALTSRSPEAVFEEIAEDDEVLFCSGVLNLKVRQ